MGSPMRLARSLLATQAWADHFAPLPAKGLSPLVTGILAGVLALAAGVLIVIIVRLLLRKPS